MPRRLGALSTGQGPDIQINTSIERQQRPFVKLAEIIRYNAQRSGIEQSLYGRRSVPSGHSLPCEIR
jgi:hypothetical protein